MGDVNLKDYFKNFEDKLLVKMPKQEEADITSATRLLEGRCLLVLTKSGGYCFKVKHPNKKKGGKW